MGTISRSHSFTAGEKPTEAQWNVDINQLITLINGNLDANNVDATAIATVASAQTISARKTFTAGIAVDELVGIANSGGGDVKLTEFRWDPASGILANGDGFYISLVADNNNSGEEHEYARMLVDLDTITNGSEASSLIFYTDVAGTLTAQLDISSAGVVCTSLLKTEDTTEATTTTDGSLQTDGGLSIAKDAVFGDDVKLLSDSAVLNFGADSDITVTHVADTGLTVAGAHANGTNLQLNNTASDGDAAIQFALSGTVAYTMGVEDGDSDKFVINYGTGALGAQPALEINTSGNTTVAGTLASGAFTSSGIIKTDDATEATSTTDGSLQTDGGLSVVKDVVIGDDLKLLSDSAVLSLGDGSDATLTHDGTTGATLAANPLALSSGTATLAITAGDVTVFDDNNNADTSLAIGTSATEALKVEVLNGGSNKTAEEIKISTATASGTANHGKISVYIDGTEIFDIDDGGIDMASGKTVAVDGTDLTSSSASNAFQTIAVSGQDNVVADSTTDTLTFAAGSNVTLTTTAASDTVTIAAAGAGGATGLSLNDDVALTLGTGNDATLLFNGTNTVLNSAGVVQIENMYFDNTGEVAVGEADPSGYGSKFSVVCNDATYHAQTIHNDGDNANRRGLKIQAGAYNASGTTAYLDCFDGNGHAVGDISNTSGTFALNDTSDVRLKENIVNTAVDGVAVINALRVVDFNWRANGIRAVGGLIADEVFAAYPSATSGRPGAVDANDDPEMMGVARDVLVPVAIKAIQQLTQRIAALEAS